MATKNKITQLPQVQSTGPSSNENRSTIFQGELGTTLIQPPAPKIEKPKGSPVQAPTGMSNKFDQGAGGIIIDIPGVKPTTKPTTKPTPKPTQTGYPNPKPSPTATGYPTGRPRVPDWDPRPKPKPTPTQTTKPTPTPTTKPSKKPTTKPTLKPIPFPTVKPTLQPSPEPSAKPTTSAPPKTKTKPKAKGQTEPSTASKAAAGLLVGLLAPTMIPPDGKGGKWNPSAIV